jgi:hypothetical protein
MLCVEFACCYFQVIVIFILWLWNMEANPNNCDGYVDESSSDILLC